MIVDAILTCPLCQHKQQETMPDNTCQSQYTCSSCQQIVKVLPNHCCIYCCYADYPCPTAQISASACCSGE